MSLEGPELVDRLALDMGIGDVDDGKPGSLDGGGPVGGRRVAAGRVLRRRPSLGKMRRKVRRVLDKSAAVAPVSRPRDRIPAFPDPTALDWALMIAVGTGAVAFVFFYLGLARPLPDCPGLSMICR